MATTFLPTMHLDQRGRGGGDVLVLVVVVVGGGFLKEDDGGVDQHGVFCALKKNHPFSACFSSDICLFY